MALEQASKGGRQAQAGAHTPLASPAKRLKTPPATPAARTLAFSPESPERSSARSQTVPAGGSLSQGRADVDAALAAVTVVIEGSCATKQHAQSAAAAAPPGRRAGVRKQPPVRAGAQHAQAARIEQGSQGVATPAKQPQARLHGAAQNHSARDALAAVHKAAAKRIAQVLLRCTSPKLLPLLLSALNPRCGTPNHDGVDVVPHPLEWHGEVGSSARARTHVLKQGAVMNQHAAEGSHLSAGSSRLKIDRHILCQEALGP